MSTPEYLICKYGGYYRPNCQGYTNDFFAAGRYTLEEAERETHPNGPDGPRDGMAYIHQDKVRRELIDPAVIAALPEARALIAVQCCMCGKRGLSTEEDGGPECELSDGRWVCSSDCWEIASALHEHPKAALATQTGEGGE